MRRTLRFALLVGVLSACLPAPAQAMRVDLPETLTSAHFQVHYEATPGLEWRINAMKAGEVAAIAERAYTTYLGWGYPAPLDDGDDFYDIYVIDEPEDVWGGTFADNPLALASSGHIQVDATVGVDDRKIAHLVFHLFQDSLWNPLDAWLRESAAEWAAFRYLGFPSAAYNDEVDELQPLTEYLGRPDTSLDCAGDRCGDTVYEQGGYARWAFFTYLGERYGTNVVKEIHDQGPAIGDASRPALDLLTDVLAAKGSTLADVFNDWSIVHMTGGYQAEGLKGATPTRYSTMLTGMVTGALPLQKIAVNHLAARYLSFRRGDGVGAAACHVATLTVNVAIPSGTASRPYFFWTAPGSTPIPLAVSGSTATISVPWDTCTWEYEGLLSLPNASSTIDAADFSVTGSITVDRTKLATATPPPPGYPGPTSPAPVTDEAPAIALYGPEVVGVTRRTRTLRLVVFSSGPGQLKAVIGSTLLGARKLRAGNNDLRFKVPKAMLRSLSARTRPVLTLTSYSPSGRQGATVTRKLRLSK